MQEEKLVKLLYDHKAVIGWTLTNIKGISPSMCMHHILLEDNAKPTREMQRRLNPPMMEVVKAEVLKLLDARVIYPITDSKWVALIHVVPITTRIMSVKNKNDELIPTRISSGWRMCVDYRKHNLSTRKDHFPLPFMDQMLEHKVFWAIKQFNLDYDVVGIAKKLQLQELEEIRNDAYENARIYNKKSRVFMTE